MKPTHELFVEDFHIDGGLVLDGLIEADGEEQTNRGSGVLGCFRGQKPPPRVTRPVLAAVVAGVDRACRFLAASAERAAG